MSLESSRGEADTERLTSVPGRVLATRPTLRRAGFPERAQGMMYFLFKERRAIVFGSLLVTASCLFLIATLGGDLTQWQAWNILISLSTLIVGIGIFLGEAIE